MREPYRGFMKIIQSIVSRGVRTGVLVLAVVTTATGGFTSVTAQTSRHDQEAIRNVAKQVRPLPILVSEIRRQSPYDRMDYLGGPIFDPVRFVYRLKFIDGNKVVFVYVDARSGRIIGRSP